MTPFITSFYTANYQDHARELIKSGRDFGLHVNVRMYAHLSGWHQAVSFKPQHILTELQELEPEDEAILWTDADSRFRRRPDFSIFDNVDVAAAKFQWSPLHQFERLTGTMFFRKSEAVIAFIEDWIALTDKWKKINRDTPEQLSLEECWRLPIHSHVRKMDLPIEWTWIEPEFNTMFVDKRPVISHLQASRERKR